METKIPFYNIINMFLTGLIFIGCCLFLFPQYSLEFFTKLSTDSIAGFETIITVSFFAVAYELGLIINRVGSIIIEPFLVKTKLIQFNQDYRLYNQARDKYSIFPTLAREYALSRTSLALFLVLSVISAVKRNMLLLVFFISIMLIFYFSFAKHSKKIVTLMKIEEENDLRDHVDEVQSD